MTEYHISKTKESALNTTPNELPEEIWTYTTSRPLEYVKYTGILTYIDGATYPRKGNPDNISTHLINIIKTHIIQVLKHPLPLLLANKQELLLSFNIVFAKTFSSSLLGKEYKVKEEYLCPTAYGVMKFVQTLLKEVGIDHNIANQFGYNIAHIFEYDDAYRYRLQDIITESNIQILKMTPRKEIKRLLQILNQRESLNNQTAPKITKHINLLLPLLYLPHIKKAFKKSAHWLDKCKYDPSDTYWASLKGDEYRFTGRTPEERTKNITVPKPIRIII